MDTVQFVMLIVVAAITGMASVLDEAQFHRPLIACTLVGLVLGDITTGIILGGTLELMALGWMNVGAAMAPDAALASVVATILVIVGHQDIAAGIALAVPLAAAGQVLTIFVRTITVFFQHLADKFAENGNTFGIEMCHVAGLMLQAIRVAVPAALVALIAGTDTVSAMLSSIPEVVTRGLQVAGGFIVVVGYAMVINMMATREVWPFFALGFVFAAINQLTLIALGVIGVCLAIIYLGLKDLAKQGGGAGGGSGDPLGDIIDNY